MPLLQSRHIKNSEPLCGDASPPQHTYMHTHIHCETIRRRTQRQTAKIKLKQLSSESSTAKIPIKNSFWSDSRQAALRAYISMRSALKAKPAKKCNTHHSETRSLQ